MPSSTDYEQDWQPYPVDPYSAICDDHTYIHTYTHVLFFLSHPAAIPRSHGYFLLPDDVPTQPFRLQFSRNGMDAREGLNVFGGFVGGFN